MFDLVAYLVLGIGIIIVIGYVLFYPMFKELINRFWEEIDKIRERLKRK